MNETEAMVGSTDAELDLIRRASVPTYQAAINAENKDVRVACPGCHARVPVHLTAALERLDLLSWSRFMGLPGISEIAMESIYKRRADEKGREIDQLKAAEAAHLAVIEDKTRENDQLERSLRESRQKVERITGELESKTQAARDDLVKALLGVPDAIDGALKHAESQENANEGYLEGVRMLRRSVDSVLGAAGFEAQDVLHAEFDPHSHEAAAAVETSDHDPGTIVDEMRRGYTNTKSGVVIRPALVGVAQAPSTELAETEPNDQLGVEHEDQDGGGDDADEDVGAAANPEDEASVAEHETDAAGSDDEETATEDETSEGNKSE